MARGSVDADRVHVDLFNEGKGWVVLGHDAKAAGWCGIDSGSDGRAFSTAKRAKQMVRRCFAAPDAVRALKASPQ